MRFIWQNVNKNKCVICSTNLSSWLWIFCHEHWEKWFVIFHVNIGNLIVSHHQCQIFLLLVLTLMHFLLSSKLYSWRFQPWWLLPLTRTRNETTYQWMSIIFKFSLCFTEKFLIQWLPHCFTLWWTIMSSTRNFNPFIQAERNYRNDASMVTMYLWCEIVHRWEMRFKYLRTRLRESATVISG